MYLGMSNIVTVNANKIRQDNPSVRYPNGIYFATINDLTDPCMVTNNEMIIHGNDYYYSGFYDESAYKWNQVLKLNGNFDLAYIGKGRAALRNDEFAEAMHYYRTKYEQQQYGRAFQLYRKYWIEQHIVHIIVIVLTLIIAAKIFGFLYRRKKGIGGSEE
jgi:tetratricopeptide (TPR) repeat protein